MRRIDNITTLLYIIYASKMLALIESRTILIPDFYDIKTLVFLNNTFRRNTDALNHIGIGVFNNLAEHGSKCVEMKVM